MRSANTPRRVSLLDVERKSRTWSMSSFVDFVLGPSCLVALFCVAIGGGSGGFAEGAAIAIAGALRARRAPFKAV